MLATFKAALAVSAIVLVGFTAGARFARTSGESGRLQAPREPVLLHSPTAAPPTEVVAPRTSAPPAHDSAASARTAVRGVLDSVKVTGALAHAAMVRRIAQRYSVEWRLVMAIIASESGGDPEAVSPVGAVGLMQLMPDTAKDLGVDPYDPEQNVDGAVRYLSSLYSMFGSTDMALIAYNAGPGFALQYRQGVVELGEETRTFLIRVGRFLEPAVSNAAPKALPGPAGSLNAAGGR